MELSVVLFVLLLLVCAVVCAVAGVLTALFAWYAVLCVVDLVVPWKTYLKLDTYRSCFVVAVIGLICGAAGGWFAANWAWRMLGGE